ncbi:type II CRISPR-associated endonuclease Cas1 [Lagierella sp.]|uniref:type II CRISPR-associated endonuclease Cas1 n=1 Tax=Lagierella sp. TaxID=2849657 RepID=UPI00260B44DE|nr:type II CRISPR-associated endonuclease Cas1 [Lagierella sp.]
MGWRQIIITGRAKLDLKMNYLVVRKDTTTKIHISEIDILVIESLQVSITTALIQELSKNKVKVIFCDETYSPFCEVTSYYGKYNSPLMLKNQINWKKENKLKVWTEIIRQKIKNQKELLCEYGKEEYMLLEGYLLDLKKGDSTNREGHAAKVYFNALFGKDFTRNLDNGINSALNYGYSLILSSFNREICLNGYLTELGIFHDNQFNFYNLSSDLMEPFRPIIDKIVININIGTFGREEKLKLMDVFMSPIKIGNRTYELRNAISIYCKGVFQAIESGNLEYMVKCEL